MSFQRKFILILTIVCAVTLSQKAMAGDDNGLNLPPEGTTIINLSATEKRTLPQDLLVASLRIEAEDKTDPAVVQKKINEAMTKALEIAKKESAFKISTGAYSVYKNEYAVITNPKTGEQKTESKWMGSQSIEIQSKDSTKLLEVVGKIQGLGFAMNNLMYNLSPALVDQTRDELLTAALKKLVAKADIVAKTLSKSKADLVDVNVDTGGHFIPMQKNMMARAEVMLDSAATMPAPVAEAGESDVQLSVTARALIK